MLFDLRGPDSLFLTGVPQCTALGYVQASDFYGIIRKNNEDVRCQASLSVFTAVVGKSQSAVIAVKPSHWVKPSRRICVFRSFLLLSLEVYIMVSCHTSKLAFQPAFHVFFGILKFCCPVELHHYRTGQASVTLDAPRTLTGRVQSAAIRWGRLDASHTRMRTGGFALDATAGRALVHVP